MGLGLLVGVWVARYLGAEQFGLLNFALAFTGLFAAIATLGMQGIVVRDIVRDQKSTNLTLGTAAILQLIGGLVSFLLIMVAIHYFRPDNILSRSIVAILGAMMLLKFSEVVVCWFESQVQSKYAVWVQGYVFVTFIGVKVALILIEAPLIAFAWSMLGEATVVAIILMLVLNHRGTPIKTLRFSMNRAKELLKDSWPLFLSAASISVYTKIDQIMIGQMLDDRAVGLYSAALRLSEIWYFIPAAIVASVFPSIIELKRSSKERYYLRLQQLYNVMVIMSLSLAIPIALLAKPLITIIFGPEFAEASTVLVFHIWAGIFIFLSIASHSWYLAENLQKLSLQRTIFCATINITLNLILIPHFGIEGAAFALLTSLAITHGFIDGIQKKTRVIFFMKLKAMNPLYWPILFHKPN